MFLAFRFTNLNNKGCWADEEKQDNSEKEKKIFCPLAKKGMRMKKLISKLFHLNGEVKIKQCPEVSEIGRICQQCNLASKLNAVFLSGISILENYCRLFDISCSQ